MRHPSFIIGAVSYVLLLLGVVMKSNSFRSGDYVIIASVVLGAIHWVWSIADVANSKHLDQRSRPFWLTMVVIIPPLGGMFYYMMKTKNVAM
ncbi:MAG: PLDc N-terminal domain-containing protein [Chitinophagaceae bacterium]